MSVTWENGKTSRGRLEVKPDGFNWDAGIFVPVEEASGFLDGVFTVAIRVPRATESGATALSLPARGTDGARPVCLAGLLYHPD